jgi:hypothetical protein
LKLNFYRIQGKARQWCKSYLNGRKQRVEKYFHSNDNIYSDWGSEKHGVPQVQYLVFFFSSYISMIYPQPSVPNPSLYS